MATTTVPETALADQPDADRAPDIGADDLLVIGANMAEAANCLLPCLSPLARKAEGHPFYDKLSAIHDWLSTRAGGCCLRHRPRRHLAPRLRPVLSTSAWLAVGAVTRMSFERR